MVLCQHACGACMQRACMHARVRACTPHIVVFGMRVWEPGEHEFSHRDVHALTHAASPRRRIVTEPCQKAHRRGCLKCAKVKVAPKAQRWHRIREESRESDPWCTPTHGDANMSTHDGRSARSAQLIPAQYVGCMHGVMYGCLAQAAQAVAVGACAACISLHCVVCVWMCIHHT